MANVMARTPYRSTAIGIALLMLPATPAVAQQASDSAAVTDHDDVLVTARRKTESLQDVPDSVRVLTGETLEAAGVRDVAGVVALTPNVTFRESFRQGQSYLTVRGITAGQQGWAPVTYVVDGVPAGANDAINTGALLGVERIELLKGPQSALYGAGAIAGAINIVTKEPGDRTEGEIVAGYGRADDRKLIGSLSTPLADDVGLRLDGYYHKGDGLQTDQLGRGLNFDRTIDLRGRAIARLDRIKLDLRYRHADIRAGAAFQELLPAANGPALIDEFENTPGLQRGIVGVEHRHLNDIAAKIDVDLGGVTLTSISGYSDLRQRLFGTTSWGAPPSTSFCGPVGGTGQAPDCTQASADNFRTITQDLRLQSDGVGPVQWLIGGSLLDRRAVNGLTVGIGERASDGGIVMGSAPFLQRADLNRDHFLGVYGQIIWNATDALQLTGALRYDRNHYSSQQFTNADLTTAVAVTGPDGQPVAVQRATDQAWQPKVQLSYRWSPAVMTYATVSKGFRSGFFNTGNRTLPEQTWNYEGGIKSNFWGNRLIANLSVFHIDYSNQQFTSIIAEPPYRTTSNIPETKINGLELDATLRLAQRLDTGVSLGLTDSKVQSQPETHGPFTPLFTSNVFVSYAREVGGDVTLSGRADYRHQSSQYLGRNDQFRIGAKDYIDLRVSIEHGAIRLTGYVRNLTDERQAFGFENVGFGYLRYNSNPRSYGVELGYRF